jgi:hypothetical protein
MNASSVAFESLCADINGRERRTASRPWRCIFLFPYWCETPAELRPLLGPLSVSWMLDELA